MIVSVASPREEALLHRPTRPEYQPEDKRACPDAYQSGVYVNKDNETFSTSAPLSRVQI